MKKQTGSPEILRKSHAHKSKKDYSRKDKWFDEHVEVIGMDKDKLKSMFIDKYKNK